jgi:hypothetical protein
MTVTIDQPPVDLTPVIDALESLKEALPTIPESKEVDMTPVVSALQDLQNTLALDNQYPEHKDYTGQFTALLEALSKPTLEKEILEALSRPYPEFNIPPDIISREGRIKVEVDKVGGNGSSRVADVRGVAVNPATSEKQDAIVTAIENITIDTENLETLATETNTKLDSEIALQTTLVSLTETLQELSRRLLVLASMANAGAPALRTIPIASVSTAVTGPMTSAQSIAEKNIAGVMYTMRVATENNTAYVANINNVIPA